MRIRANALGDFRRAGTPPPLIGGGNEIQHLIIARGFRATRSGE
jgi:hypothetical protein